MMCVDEVLHISGRCQSVISGAAFSGSKAGRNPERYCSSL